jgi:hypothetical protein
MAEGYVLYRLICFEIEFNNSVLCNVYMTRKRPEKLLEIASSYAITEQVIKGDQLP